MKYIRLIATLLAALCLLCACNTNSPESGTDRQPVTQSGGQYQSSFITGISKESACKNPDVAAWIELCAAEERNDIGHYVLRNTVDNGDGTSTHHLLLYRSSTEQDAKSFEVSFAEDGELLTVTCTYTSSDKSQYGYDLVYLTLQAESDLRVLPELVVDGDYPGQIVTATQKAITPDTFGTQNNE